MELELRNIRINDVILGKQNRLFEGVLTLDAEALRAHLMEDDRIASIRIDVAKPGESCRIVPVKDVIEPRVKEEGEIFPGSFGSDVPEVGSGITYVLKGCAVVTTGPIVGFQEGVIDMSGPGAQYSMFSNLINIVLHIEKRSDLDPHEHEKTVRLAGLKAASWIAAIGRDYADYEAETISWPSLEERASQYPGLPKVVYVCNCMAQGLLHDTYYYGRDAKLISPVTISPNEYADGAVVSGNCVSPGSKTTTYHHLNNAVIRSLLARDGKELNFIGIVLVPLMVTLKEKYRNIMITTRLVCDELNADASLISQEGFGNPTTDLMRICHNLEKRNVKTVIITNEDAGIDGMSEPLPDMLPEANAIVSTGNSNATILLPPMERVLGHLSDVKSVTGGSVESIKEDGSLLMEIHGIMGSHNLQGNTYLTAKTL